MHGRASMAPLCHVSLIRCCYYFSPYKTEDGDSLEGISVNKKHNTYGSTEIVMMACTSSVARTYILP